MHAPVPFPKGSGVDWVARDGGYSYSEGPLPCECDDLATAWTSSVSAHPATSLLALPVLSSFPCPIREQRGMWGEEPSQCPVPPTPGYLPGPELGAFT